MDGWKQIFVDKRKRLVQGVCIDSATRGLSLTPPVLSEEPRKAIHTMNPNDLASALAAIPSGRSAWNRAVHTYAIELVESLDASTDLSNETLLRKALLNGADDWHQYSEGGCALVYDADIAERICSPSELKRCKGGERQPNARETWLDCQARALAQAASLVRRAYRKAARSEGGAA